MIPALNEQPQPRFCGLDPSAREYGHGGLALTGDDFLGVNMQTSFMHPPFGFALFYLRSVAPREAYADRISGKRMAPVTTAEIYWGAVPFVLIQAIAVALVISLPSLVMHYKGAGSQVDPSKIKIEIPPPDLPPPLDFGEPPKTR